MTSKTISEAQLAAALKEWFIQHGFGPHGADAPSLFAALPDDGLDVERVAERRATVERIRAALKREHEPDRYGSLPVPNTRVNAILDAEGLMAALRTPLDVDVDPRGRPAP